MNPNRKILEDLAAGKISVEDAEKMIQTWALEEISGVAVIDSKREERSGVPEVIYGASKSIEQLNKIIEVMLRSNGYALITRLDENKVEAITRRFSERVIKRWGCGEVNTIVVTDKNWQAPEIKEKIAIISAGTSDIPYAGEVQAIASVMGIETLTFNDVGVAGVHRLIRPLQKIIEEDVAAIVVLAGMEGALPTFVASLIDIPVIGVPVPTGYGFGGEGQTALAAMLQSCAPGIAVVNIGNGIGAGSVACLIAKKCASRRNK